MVNTNLQIKYDKYSIMGIEIERKYLVKDDSYKQMSVKHSHVSQGYLNRDPMRTVRVRLLDDKGFLTVKGVTRHAEREEYEYEIPASDARSMLRICEDGILTKTRWYVPYDGFIWDVDEYGGHIAPLVVAEIELPSADTPHNLPPFVGEEVTGDPRYYNSSLALVKSRQDIG